MSGSSIFDSIMGNISSFSDAIGPALEGSGLLKGDKSSSDNESQQEYRALRLQNLINSDKTNQPYGVSSFSAGKSQAAPQVNSEEVNQRWLERLSRYSTIQQVQGAKAKGT